MFQIRDLLGGAVGRACVSKQIISAQAVSATNEIIAQILPGNKSQAASAISLRDSILTIQSTNASTTQFLHDNESVILTKVREKVPEANVRQIRYRIVHHFKHSEL